MMRIDEATSLHQRIIGALPVREWQVDSQPIDNIWIIQTAREGERSKPVAIPFNAPISPWPKPSRLDAAEHINDLITAKLLVWYALEPAPIGWLRTGSSVPGFHRRNLNFFRWKHHIGVHSNSDLEAAHHRDFVARFRAKGLEGMLDITSRAKQLVAADRAGTIQLPRGERGYFFHAGVEELLGLTINQTPPEAIAVLSEYAQEIGVPFQRYDRKRMGQQTRNITKTAAFAQISVWQTLWNFNEFLEHDPLQYDAYSDKGELQRSFSGWAEDGRKTPDAPTYQASWLIDAAIRLIFDEAVENILAISDDGYDPEQVSASPHLALIQDRIDALGFGPIANLYRRSRWQSEPRDIPTVRELIFRLLATAGVIAIAAFGARRDCELQALRPGCIQLDQFGNLWLHCWIAKNRRELTKIPTNRVAQRAVHILERLGLLAAVHGDPEWLLEYFDPYGPVEYKFNEALRQFSEWVKVPPLPDGSYWEFASHQFRKFFAVSYQWRYFFPDFGALNHHLRQSIDVTAGYAKMRGAATLRQYDKTQARLKAWSPDWVEMDRFNALRDEEENFIAEILRMAIEDGETLGGPKGRALTVQLQQKFFTQINVGISGERDGLLNREIQKLAKGLHMRTHPEGHGICGCGTSSKDKETAGCLIQREKRTGEKPSAQPEPDMSFADDEICCRCVHNIRIKRLLPYWERAFDDAIAASRSSVADVARAGQQRADFIECHILSEF
jgi:hypothetical protein